MFGVGFPLFLFVFHSLNSLAVGCLITSPTECVGCEPPDRWLAGVPVVARSGLSVKPMLFNVFGGPICKTNGVLTFLVARCVNHLFFQRFWWPVL